ncbi:MAG TPA: hypothetical protein ENG35_00480 [Desulfobacteraceae bacterium]|nr:hypothetical protein [Desulfobacteraceae bacterium]
MNLKIDEIVMRSDKYAGFLSRLSDIYAFMDRKYKEAADYYGFNCMGCDDTCCRTLFYHHTVVEYLYLIEGYRNIDPAKQSEVSGRASRVCMKIEEIDGEKITLRLLCPFNFDGLCVIYKYRPMICRLHGIPHELQKPGQAVFYGSGCKVFTDQNKKKDYFKFNRTPFYIEMAQLENELKQYAGITCKFKMTIAEMVRSMKNRDGC